MLNKKSLLFVATIIPTGPALTVDLQSAALTSRSAPIDATLENIPNVPMDGKAILESLEPKRIPLDSCYFNILAGLTYLALQPKNGVTTGQAWSTPGHDNTKVTLKPEATRGFIPNTEAMWGMVLCAQDLWVLSIKTEQRCTINQGDVTERWLIWGTVDFTSTVDTLSGPVTDHASFRREISPLKDVPLRDINLVEIDVPLTAINPADITITLSPLRIKGFLLPHFLFGFFTEVILNVATRSDREAGIAYDYYQSSLIDGYGLKLRYASVETATTASYELVVRALAMLPETMFTQRVFKACEFEVQLKGVAALKGRLAFVD